MHVSRNFIRTLFARTPRTKHINDNRFWLIWLSRALITREIMHSAIEEIQFKLIPHFNARVFLWLNILIHKLGLQDFLSWTWYSTDVLFTILNFSYSNITLMFPYVYYLMCRQSLTKSWPFSDHKILTFRLVNNLNAKELSIAEAHDH